MVFGEIVEPSTRALILDDELEELPEYRDKNSGSLSQKWHKLKLQIKPHFSHGCHVLMGAYTTATLNCSDHNPFYRPPLKPTIKWEGDPQVPQDIENLIFADSPKVVQFCLKITKGVPPVVKIVNEGLAIYKFNNTYLVVFDGNCKNLVVGEIVQSLSSWIRKAKFIHAITSALITTFQPFESLGGVSPATFTRCLTNLPDVPYNFCKRLESPNLISGFGASILTYCIHCDLKASFWVIYMDHMPIDSINSAELVRLFKNFEIEVKIDFKADSLSSNLYM